jgi:hypothetical protein
MHFFGWKKGLKTGMYYLRTRSAADAIKFTVSAAALAEAKESTTRAASQPPKAAYAATNGVLDTGLSKLAISDASVNVSAPVKPAPAPAPVSNGFATSPKSSVSSTSTPTVTASTPVTPPEQDEGEEEISYEEAVRRREAKKFEEEKLLCSLENPESCTMCSG